MVTPFIFLSIISDKGIGPQPHPISRLLIIFGHIRSYWIRSGPIFYVFDLKYVPLKVLILILVRIQVSLFLILSTKSPIDLLSIAEVLHLTFFDRDLQIIYLDLSVSFKNFRQTLSAHQ